jgi:hypothetical protein
MLACGCSFTIVIPFSLPHNPHSGKVEIGVTGITLPPIIATVLFVLACLSGYQYRRVWKTEGPRWQLWLYGLFTAIALLVLGFVPLSTAG